MSRGRFIVLEGIDGAGTTTQAERLEAWLREAGHDAVLTREPTDGPVGTLIRRVLAKEVAPPPPPDAVAMLFAADRLDHLLREIEPALGRGAHVVSDRYYLSSIAYQSQASDRELVMRLNERARPPDLTLYLAVSPEVAEHRRDAAGRPTELFDELILQRRIAAAYDSLAARPPRGEKIVKIDGNGEPDAVERAIRAAVEPLVRR